MSVIRIVTFTKSALELFAAASRSSILDRVPVVCDAMSSPDSTSI